MSWLIKEIDEEGNFIPDSVSTIIEDNELIAIRIALQHVTSHIRDVYSRVWIKLEDIL